MKGHEMSKIIDLNFYRKFRIILPLRKKGKKSSNPSSSRQKKPSRRQRHTDKESNST